MPRALHCYYNHGSKVLGEGHSCLGIVLDVILITCQLKAMSWVIPCV